MAGRRVDVIAAKLDVQQLVVLQDKYFLDDLQRQLAGLDVVRPHPVPGPDLVNALEPRLRREPVSDTLFYCQVTKLLKALALPAHVLQAFERIRPF